MNEKLKAFDNIRPFEPEELPAAYDRLLANEQFKTVVQVLYPQVPFEAIATKMRHCTTSLEFQKVFGYEFLTSLLAKASTGCDFDASAIDNQRRYTFMSNHRDIVLDAALLDKLLLDAGFSTTCEIAIGDNLLALPWVKDLVRINKSFIVMRGLSIREKLIASKRLSEYMHLVINLKNDNIWIAQRQGRAKDSNDRTQDAIIKMMTMGGTGSAIERLIDLHIVPLAISYEYDPCDWLKARELQLRRDVENWHKGPMDDVESMRTGIVGYKGRIHYEAAPCIDGYLRTLDAAMPQAEFYKAVAEHIDREIHLRYRLYPGNYIAMDLLAGNEGHTDHYTAEEAAQFEQYIARQLSQITLPNRDEDYLRERLLTMYANPAINQLAAQQASNR